MLCSRFSLEFTAMMRPDAKVQKVYPGFLMTA